MDSFLFNFKLKKKQLAKLYLVLLYITDILNRKMYICNTKVTYLLPFCKFCKKNPWINGMSYSVLHAGQFLHRSKVKCSDLHLTLKVLEKRSVIESILNQPSNLYLSVSNWVKFYQFQPLSTDSHQATMKNIKHFASFAKICAIIYYVII